MTTEQMDWLDDERAGRHKVPNTADRRKAALAQGPEILFGTPSEEEIAAARGRAGSRGVMVLPTEMRDSMIASGGGWRSQHPVVDGEEHAHYTREGRDRCAAGDHEAAELFDRQAEREKIAAAEKRDADDWEIRSSDETTMAEEPIEDRLRRQWLNGYMMGFREGFERAGWLDHS